MLNLLPILHGVLDVIYPPSCLVCGVRMTTGALCDTCIRGFVALPPPFCDRCGTPIPAARLVCASCETGPEPPYYWSQAMGQYTGTLRRAIHRLKYDGKTALAAPLGCLLAYSLDNPPSPLLYPTLYPTLPAGLTGAELRARVSLDFDLVVPIPLHPTRLQRRGFNQAERIAFYMAQQRGWKLDAYGLRRIRKTKTQTALDIAARAANVQGVFVPRTPDRFAGKSVLLVDDVLTTTATVKEAARSLQEAGAVRVGVAALARGI